MDILDRILMLLGNREQRELTNFLGLKSVAFSEWKSGKSKSYKKYLIEIADFFNISLDYLVYGKEKGCSTFKLTDEEQELLEYFNKLSDKSKGKIIERAAVLAELEMPVTNEPVAVEEPEEKRLKINCSTYQVSAGAGFELGEGDEWYEIEVPDTSKARKADFALQIKGNSMEPIYFNGDIVLVKEQPYVNIGEIGIFIIDGNGYIKKRGNDRLISINPEYDDIYFREGQDIRCKGLVIGTLEDDDFV